MARMWLSAACTRWPVYKGVHFGYTNAIIAGDINRLALALHGGLRGIDGINGTGNTWPASCKSLGDHRGDNICSNLKQATDDDGRRPVLEPCVHVGPINIHIDC